MKERLQLQNDISQVPLLAGFVEEVCENAGLDMATTQMLNLALEEAVVNVMNYAYAPGTVGDIFIDAGLSDSRLEFVISDFGIPFDPTAREDADTTLNAEERPIGGLGIHLVRQIMDSVRYERDGNSNMLFLTKNLP